MAGHVAKHKRRCRHEKLPPGSVDSSLILEEGVLHFLMQLIDEHMCLRVRLVNRTLYIQCKTKMKHCKHFCIPKQFKITNRMLHQIHMWCPNVTTLGGMSRTSSSCISSDMIQKHAHAITDLKVSHTQMTAPADVLRMKMPRLKSLVIKTRKPEQDADLRVVLARATASSSMLEHLRISCYNNALLMPVWLQHQNSSITHIELYTQKLSFPALACTIWPQTLKVLVIQNQVPPSMHVNNDLFNDLCENLSELKLERLSFRNIISECQYLCPTWQPIMAGIVRLNLHTFRCLDPLPDYVALLMASVSTNVHCTSIHHANAHYSFYTHPLLQESITYIQHGHVKLESFSTDEYTKWTIPFLCFIRDKTYITASERKTIHRHVIDKTKRGWYAT